MNVSQARGVFATALPPALHVAPAPATAAAAPTTPTAVAPTVPTAPTTPAKVEKEQLRKTPRK